MFRQPVKLCSYEPAVVASLLKLFLRELPEPVLTTRLGARFVIIIVIVYYSLLRQPSDVFVPLR